MHQILIIKKIRLDHLVSSEVHFSKFQRWPPYFTVLSDNEAEREGKENGEVEADDKMKE